MRNNIHILPTDKPSRLYYNTELPNNFIYNANNFPLHEDLIKDKFQPQNIYITNSEEIKEGDWFLTPLNDLEYANKDWIITILKFTPKTDFKKIILTTDQDLIKDGVQDINDEFLKWFVNNPSCEVVEVVKTAPIRPFGSLYKIIIPKEEAKKKHIVMLVGDKVNDEPKQETLEEISYNYAKDKTNRTSHLIGFREGAKWQMERSYSEEEVENLLYYIRCNAIEVEEGWQINGENFTDKELLLKFKTIIKKK